MKVKDVVNTIEKWAKKDFIDSWDKTGFQIGDLEEQVSGILISLDVTDLVISKAIEENANLIITHHPFIFKPLESITFDNYQGKLIQKIIKNNLTIYNLHTNLDIAPNGINDVLADTFTMKNTVSIEDVIYESLYKIITFVPEEYTEKILQAYENAGAGHIGNYSNCTFTSSGTGRFIAMEGSNPFIGSEGVIERVKEVKVEAVVKEENIERTIESIIENHPYEEVSYDIIPLKNFIGKYGYGKIGDIQEIDLSALIELVKKKLDLDYIKVYGELETKVNRIAVCGGSGSDFITSAAKKGAQVYITGDIKYHDAQLAHENGIILIDGTHYGTESLILEKIMDYLKENVSHTLRITVFEDKVFNGKVY